MRGMQHSAPPTITCRTRVFAASRDERLATVYQDKQCAPRQKARQRGRPARSGIARSKNRLRTAPGPGLGEGGFGGHMYEKPGGSGRSGGQRLVASGHARAPISSSRNTNACARSRNIQAYTNTHKQAGALQAAAADTFAPKLPCVRLAAERG